ncbi:Duf757 domain-containing protein [Mycena kentingensis (nom. inval.)]|nr:Duf757 domain-containing protein [Mycena kentingensis (nom. inval.)]
MSRPFDPNTAENHIDIEKQFAVKAVEQAQTYWNLIEKVAPSELKLTKLDDEIFEDTLATFPELAENDHARLTKLDEDWMKSAEGKERWRAFIERYKKKVKDYNFGSLIRTDAREEYGEKNTIFVTRIQFYAFEIARNRLGLNDAAHELAKVEAAKEKAQKEKDALAAEKKKGTGAKRK